MKLIDFETAAGMLGVSTKTIGRMCGRKELRKVAIPGKPKDDGGTGRPMNRVDEDEVKRKVAAWAQAATPARAVAKPPAAAVRRGRVRRQAL